MVKETKQTLIEKAKNVSTNHFDSAPQHGNYEELLQPANPADGERKATDVHVSIDPQQQFREYALPDQGNVPATPFPPAYAAPGFYQPGQAGLVVGTPGGMPPGYNGMVPVTPYGPQMAYPPDQVAGVQPGYQSYAGYGGVPGQVPFHPGYQAYAQPTGYPAYPGYPMYSYGWQMLPQRPKRDTYLLAVGIIAFSCSILVVLGGLGSLLLVGLVDLSQSLKATLSDGTYFAVIVLLLSFSLAGIVGGGFCLYHSIRSLFLRKASRTIWLPRFWIFLPCYLATIGVGFWIHSQGLDAHPSVLIGLLVYLGGVFPALTIMALGVRRLSFPKADRPAGKKFYQTWFRKGERRVAQWPTSWRRWTLALVSGATLSIALALILETIFQMILLNGAQNEQITQFLTGPSDNLPPSLYALALILLAVVAPLVEELVKPLAVVVLIGRVRSKAEAFVLGLACGIGFNLVETTGYISSNYNDWLTVALVRSGAGLLHGFGAAMVALGWYYLTHKEEGRWPRRLLLTLGCAGYAVLQHAFWNGSLGLAFLPGPIGEFFRTWSWGSGSLVLDGGELLNIVTVIAILVFFIFMSGRLRTSASQKAKEQLAEEAPLFQVQQTV